MHVFYHYKNNRTEAEENKRLDYVVCENKRPFTFKIFGFAVLIFSSPALLILKFQDRNQQFNPGSQSFPLIVF